MICIFFSGLPTFYRTKSICKIWRITRLLPAQWAPWCTTPPTWISFNWPWVNQRSLQCSRPQKISRYKGHNDSFLSGRIGIGSKAHTLQPFYIMASSRPRPFCPTSRTSWLPTGTDKSRFVFFGLWKHLTMDNFSLLNVLLSMGCQRGKTTAYIVLAVFSIMGHV